MAKSLNLKYIVLFSIFALFSLFFWQRPTHSQWLSGWLYREPVIIKEQSGSTLTDYQIRIELDDDYFDFSLCKADGSDIRFADESNNLLSFWIESWPDPQSTSKTAIIWVKIPRLEPFEKKKIYMYYGNPLATSYSNLTETMDLIEVVKAQVSSTPTTVPFVNDPSVAIASPPGFEHTETCSVNLYKQNGAWHASLSESSISDNQHGAETVYFLGAEAGTFILTDGTIIDASTVTVNHASGPLLSTSEQSWNIARLLTTPLFTFGSLNSRPVDNAQLRLAQLRISEPSGFYLKYSVQHEYDSTEFSSTSYTASLVRIKPTAGSTVFYNLTNNTYQPVLFAAAETTQTQLPFLHEGPFFINVNSVASYLPFIRFDNDETSPSLILQFDETAPAAETTFQAQLSAVLFSSTGVFPAAKYASVPPSVHIARISGRVFEDTDLNGKFDEQTDRPKKGVRVRIYHDTNANDEIDAGDVFVLETRTDSDGEYFFPARRNARYLIAVDALSIRQNETNRLNPNYTVEDILPEGYSTTTFIDGKLLTLIKPGGKNFSVTDHWSQSVSPDENDYEHVSAVETGSFEMVQGIDFGFSYEIVTSSIDEAPYQGTLRQAVINSNALRGRQKIVFFLTPDDPAYSSLLSEYEIELYSALPDLTDSVIIDGNLDGASVLLKSANVYLNTCFRVLAPATEIRNLRFAGFNTAILVEEPQKASTIKVPASIPADSLVPIAAPSLTSPVFFNQLSSFFMPFIRAVDDLGNQNCWLTAESSTVVMFENGSVVETTSLYHPGVHFTPPDYTHSAAMSIFGSFKLDTEVTLTPDEPVIVFDTETLEHAPSYLHAGYRFLFPTVPGDTFYITPVNTTSCPVAVEEIFSPQLATSRSAVAPSHLSADATATILLSSSNPVVVFKNVLPVFPVSTDLFGLIDSTMTVVSSEDTFIDIFASNDSGTAHTSAFISRGLVYTLDDFPEIKALSEEATVTAVHLISGKPVAAYGATAFVPTERTGNSWFIPFPADTVYVASLHSTTISVGTSATAVQGQLDSPGLIQIGGLPARTWLHSSAPVLVYFKNHINGKLQPAYQAIETAFHADGFIQPTEPEVYDSNVLISGCTFLANTTAVVVNSGTGITVSENRFVGNGYLVDMGNNGPDPSDGLIDENQVNLGVDRPVITHAVAEEGTTLTVSGYIGTTSTTQFATGEVEIYLTDRDGQSNMLLGRVPVENGSFSMIKIVTGMSVTAYDYVTAIYQYPDGSSSEFSDAVRVDPAPVISNVNATHILPASDTTPQPTVTTITWNTDIPATSKVVYDTVSHAATETYAFETTETTTLVTTHTVVLTGLDTNTIYYFRVISANEFSEVTTSYEFMIPPGRAEADTDLCAACHRAHTGVNRPLRLLPYQRP